MLEATSIALPRSLERRGFTLKSKTMSLTTRSMRERGAEDFLHGAPLLAQCGLLPVVERLGLGLEPGVDLVLRAESLLDVARLIDEIQHHAVVHAFVELVGVDVAAEHFEAGLLVLLEQRRAGEADEHRAGQHRLHRLVQLAALGAVALVHEDEQLAHGRAGLLLQLLDEGVEIIHALPAELVDQRAEQARLGLAELRHQVAAAAGAIDGLAAVGEDALDLFVEFIAVGEDEHAGLGHVFQDPLGQQHHDDAFAAALGVPDDAAEIFDEPLLRRLDAEILVHARQFLDAAIEEHEVVHQLDEPVLAAHFQEILVELEA